MGPTRAESEVVVGRRHPEKGDVVRSHGSHAGHDVLGGHRDMLDSRAVVEFQVLLDLRSPLSLGRFTLIGNLIRPRPSETTLDMSAEYSVLMSLSSNEARSEKPSTSL